MTLHMQVFTMVSNNGVHLLQVIPFCSRLFINGYPSWVWDGLELSYNGSMESLDDLEAESIEDFQKISSSITL
jgi:hypothetical protein